MDSIYDDLDVHPDLHIEYEQLQSINHELTTRIAYLESEVARLQEEIHSMKQIQANMEMNISSLFKTAQAEIARKDHRCDELQCKLDELLFRRGGKRSRDGSVSAASHLDEVLLMSSKSSSPHHLAFTDKQAEQEGRRARAYSPWEDGHHDRGYRSRSDRNERGDRYRDRYRDKEAMDRYSEKALRERNQSAYEGRRYEDTRRRGLDEKRRSLERSVRNRYKYEEKKRPRSPPPADSRSESKRSKPNDNEIENETKLSVEKEITREEAKPVIEKEQVVDDEFVDHELLIQKHIIHSQKKIRVSPPRMLTFEGCIPKETQPEVEEVIATEEVVKQPQLSNETLLLEASKSPLPELPQPHNDKVMDVVANVGSFGLPAETPDTSAISSLDSSSVENTPAQKGRPRPGRRRGVFKVVAN